MNHYVSCNYGQWAGDPKGTEEDLTQCVEEIFSGKPGDHGHQCSRKRGHGRQGLYCKQHAKKLAAREARWAAVTCITELEQAAAKVDWDAVANVLDEIVVDEGDESLIADIRSFAALLQGKPE